MIGENVNTTRKIRATSPNIVHEDGKVGYAYTGLDGARRLLGITDVFPEDPAELKTAQDEYAVSYLKYVRAQKK